jgi:hypothetical protein
MVGSNVSAGVGFTAGVAGIFTGRATGGTAGLSTGEATGATTGAWFGGIVVQQFVGGLFERPIFKTQHVIVSI